MPDPRRFRHQLAARIVGVLGAAALLSPGASCGVAVLGTAASGTGGGRPRPGSGTTTGTGGHGGAADAGGDGGHGGAADAGGQAGSGGVIGTGGAGTAGGQAGTGGLSGSGGASTGGAGGVGGAGGAGGGFSPPTQVCLAWPVDGQACPTDPVQVLAVFDTLGCPLGWEPKLILSGPVPKPPDLCCYVTETAQCGPGGRPYFEGHEARLATPVRGAGSQGWSRGDAPDLHGLTPQDRASLAETWTVAALFEHASIASFSRASLELLAAGAPADLVALAHEAALDEVRHAQLCFGLASAYVGEDVAPGPFPIGGAVHLRAGLVDIAVGTVVEGCVGETVAAVTAVEQLARATDPAVRAALARIAEDEARHAELAWRTVAWAVRVGGDEVRAAVAHALLAAITGGYAACDGAPESKALPAHGQLDERTRAEIVASAMADVVGPSTRALLLCKSTSFSTRTDEAEGIGSIDLSAG